MKPQAAVFILTTGIVAAGLSACAHNPNSASSTAPAATAAPLPTTQAAMTPAPANASPAITTSANPTVVLAKVDFAQQVKPFLEYYCYRCHGGGQGRGGVQLDIRSSAFQHIKPGDPAHSDVYRAITRSMGASDHMPPVSVDQPDDSEIAMIKQWIAEGAAWPDGS